VRVGPGHKGPHVTEVLSVDSSTAAPAKRSRSSFGETTSSGQSAEAVEETGTVKWFNTEKGFGFIARGSGRKDVFVHISAVERSGLTGLSEGDRVIVNVAEWRKGLEGERRCWWLQQCGTNRGVSDPRSAAKRYGIHPDHAEPDSGLSSSPFDFDP
jgi:cold shock CspA family protein